MLDVRDLAIALGISRKTVYALVADNQIPFYRIGSGRGTIRFDLQEVKDALRNPLVTTPVLPKQRTGRKHLI